MARRKGISTGTTAQRTIEEQGHMRFNSTTNLLEYYDGTNWTSIDVPPTISSVDTTEVASAEGGNATIVVTGSNFKSGAVVTFVGSSANFNADTTTVDSATQITAVVTKSSFLNAQEPYGVKVTNPSNLSVELTGQINVDNPPNWTTSSGNIGTVYEDVAISTITVAATDPESDTISYSVSSGSLPTGLSLGSANGQITGTPNVSDTYNASGVTHSFDLRATANSKTTDRTFNILRKWKDGSSSATAPSSPQDIRDLGITTDGLYYLDPDGGGAAQFDCKFNIGGGNYGFACAMIVKNPYFFGEMLLNIWDGHSGQAGPVYSSTATTYNSNRYSYMPDNASHVLLAWHNNYSSHFGAETDYVHTTTVGSSASNTGFWATGSHNASYTPSSVVAYSVSGWSNTSGATWHFRDHNGASNDYLPRGFSRGLSHGSSADGTNDLFGAIADGCSNFTSQSGAGNLNDKSETYVGNRKNIDNSGAGGSYCSAPSSGNNDGWSMWWR